MEAENRGWGEVWVWFGVVFLFSLLIYLSPAHNQPAPAQEDHCGQAK